MKNVNGFFTAWREEIKTAIILIVVVIVLTACSSVFGYVQFYHGFKNQYLSAHTPSEFKTLINKTKCSICHDNAKKKPNGTSDKKFRNPYGTALDELLSKDDKKDKEKIYKALETISSQKAPDTDKTYGERIKEYKLPYPVIEEVLYYYD